jgi:hypothetical protein
MTLNAGSFVLQCLEPFTTDKALGYFATHPETMLGLFGFTAKKAAWHSNRPPRFPKANLNIYSLWTKMI